MICISPTKELLVSVAYTVGPQYITTTLGRDEGSVN